MPRQLRIPALLIAVILGGAVVARDLHARETAPETVVVRRGPLGSIIKTKGVFVSTKTEAMTIRPKVWGGKLEIVEAAREGTVVKGQVLVQFDDADLKREIEAARRALASGRNRLERAERETALKAAERALAMDSAVRAKRIADEKLEQFVIVERKLRETEAIHRVDGWKDGLKNQLEELQQLEKMYAEDDLTEETEEIVLRRARRSYERALERFAFTKQRHAWFMTQTLPREHENLRLAVRKTTTKLDRLTTTQPLDIVKDKLSLEDTRRGQEALERRLADLLVDAEAFQVKAPMAGYAVPGIFRGGKWSGLDTTPDLLKAGTTVKPGTVLFTVVDPESLAVETAIKEVDLVHVRVGLPAALTTAVTGKEPLEGKIDAVARYGTGGQYAVRVILRAKHARLRTGLGCEVRITKEAPEEVLSVPASCILVEDDSFFVFVLGADGPEQVEVEVGRKAEGRCEITKGLKAGQRVLKTPPDDEDDDANEDDDADDDDKRKSAKDGGEGKKE